jgi:hypothetical protein
MDFINTQYYKFLIIMIIFIMMFLALAAYRFRRTQYNAFGLTPTLGRWAKLLTHAWRVRFRMALWAALGHHLQEFGAEFSYLLRKVYLPPSGVPPKKTNRLKQIEADKRK